VVAAATWILRPIMPTETAAVLAEPHLGQDGRSADSKPSMFALIPGYCFSTLRIHSWSTFNMGCLPPCWAAASAESASFHSCASSNSLVAWQSRRSSSTLIMASPPLSREKKTLKQLVTLCRRKSAIERQLPGHTVVRERLFHGSVTHPGLALLDVGALLRTGPSMVHRPVPLPRRARDQSCLAA